MQTTAEIFIYLGLIGAAEFAALAFASHQFATVGVPARLRRKLDSSPVRHARIIIALCAMVAVVGLVLHP